MKEIAQFGVGGGMDWCAEPTSYYGIAYSYPFTKCIHVSQTRCKGSGGPGSEPGMTRLLGVGAGEDTYLYKTIRGDPCGSPRTIPKKPTRS